MSARKSRGTSRTPTDSPVTSDSGAFNNGDVIWAPYRKSPAWPSIVSRVYPKKLTYHFLPLLGDEVSKKTPAFSCDPKKARLFSESDQLPADATSDLVKAFKAARTLLGLESAKDSPLNSSKRNTSRSPLRQKPKGVEKKPVVEDDEKRSNATVDDDEEVDETDGFRHDDVVLIKMNNEPEWPAVIGQVFKKYVAFHFLPVTDKSKPRKVAKQHVRKLDVYQVAELIKKVEDEELRKALICAQKLVEVKADVDVIRSLTNGSDSNEAADVVDAAADMKKTTTPTTPIGSASSTRRATRNASAAVAEEQSSASQPAVDGPSKDNLSAKLPAEENEWNVLADASVSEPAVAASVPSREDTQLPIRKRRAVTRADGIHEEEAKKQKRSAAKKPKQPKRAAKRSAEGVEVDAEQGTSSGRVSNATDHSDEFVSIEKELKELRSKSGTPNTDYHLAVGDVAWAKYGRWPQWPVLVTGYNRKRREYSYVFLPIKSLPFKEPKHKFRAKKLERFSDKYFDLYNPSDVELAQAVTQAKDIQQGKLDPFSKLAESRDSRQVRREAKANGNAEAAGAIDSFPRRESMQTPEPDEAESSVQDSDTPPSTSSCATPPPTVLSDDTRLKIAKRRARNEPLVEYALSDECKQHLLAVVRQQVDCPRDAAWRAAKSSKLKMSTVEANAGPICDDDQIERLVDRLLEWLETEMNSSPDASRLPRTARFSYVVSVWLPEAVKFAMQAVWSCSAEVAEETLNKPKEFLEEELLEVRQQMNDVRDVVGMSSNSPFEQLVAAACLTRSNEFVD